MMTVEKALANLEAVWSVTDILFDTKVTSENALQKPVTLRNPFIFYLGHLPAFASNTLATHTGPTDDKTCVWQGYDTMFSRGIDPDVDDPQQCHDHPDAPSQWPAWHDVTEYRDAVRNAVRNAVRAAVHVDGDNQVSPRLLAIVTEHEAMHIETLHYMLAQKRRRRGRICCTPTLPSSAPLRVHLPAPLPTSSNGRGKTAHDNSGRAAETVVWCAVPAGETATGNRNPSHFVWDNELDGKQHKVAAFRLAKHAVTIGDFKHFIQAGGYATAAYWTAGDWQWIQASGMRHPASWECTGNIEQDDARFSILPAEVADDDDTLVRDELPVSVSLAEARAYARFRGHRLPTELEWLRAAYPGGDGDGDVYAMEHEMGTGPVSVTRGATSPCGAVGLVGNGWELTEGEFSAFEGFKPMDEYEEYSMDFFDGKHFVLKGASWQTMRMLVRRTFRNFFQARYPFVFSKFRLVEVV